MLEVKEDRWFGRLDDDSRKVKCYDERLGVHIS